MAALVQQLDTYSKVGIPKLQHQQQQQQQQQTKPNNHYHLAYVAQQAAAAHLGRHHSPSPPSSSSVHQLSYEDEVEEALYSLEEDWTDVVRGALVMGERAR